MNDSPTLVCIPPKQIDELWPHIEPLIDDAYARFGSQDERRKVEDDIRNGLALVWIAWSDDHHIEAALVTDLLQEDGAVVCRLRALSGRKLTRWLGLLAEVEKHARAEKCKCVRYFGRLGWKAMLGPEYKVTHVQAEKQLKN